MAPPGRRRTGRSFSILYLLSATAIISFLAASIPTAAAAIGSGVIGIDLGTEYITAALVKPGVPLEIVLTKDSKRKQAASVAFKPARENDAVFPERFYGSDATALAARFPDDVYANLKTLLGIPLDTGIQGTDVRHQNLVDLYKERYPGPDIQPASDGRGTVGFKSKKLGEKEGLEPFLVEELLSMQLKEVKANAEVMGSQKTVLRDAVITFPPYFTAEEKRSVELAAELAGLTVIGMISDGMAVGLNYATSRTFPSVSDGNEPEHHVVFDMGAGSTSATVLRFQSRTVKDVGRYNKTVQEVHVVGAGWDKTLGGDSLNQLIVDDMVEKLISSNKLKGDVTAAQVKAHGKTMAKFWKESERLRQILSANSATTGSFEGLFQDDVNLKYSLDRATFEQLAEDHGKRVAAPLADALSAAGLTVGEVESIILHGGGTRTPFVQKQVEKFGPGKIRTNVNADEAAAFGAAFKGAANSPSFRVKEIRTNDTPGYIVGMKWNTGEKDRQQKLFTPYSAIGAEKHLTMNNLDDFELDFYQQYSRDDETVQSPVLGVKTMNLTDSVTKLKDEFGCTPANITTKISVRLSSLDGLPEIASGNVSCEVNGGEKKGVVEDVKEFFGLGSKKTDQEPLEAAAAESIDLDATPSSSTPSPSASPSAETETESASSSKESDKPKDVKPRIESIPIGFTSHPLGIPSISAEELLRIKNRLAEFDASDLARVKREEAFNELEGYIYRAREWVEDEELKKAITTEALDKLVEQLSATGNWLEEDGSEAKTPELKERLSSLKALLDPVLKRKNEHSLRPAKVDTLKSNLSTAKTLLEVMETQIKEEESLISASSDSEATATDTSESASTTSSTESSSEDFDSLEDDHLSSSSTTESASPSAKPSPAFSLYTPDDLSSLTTIHDSVSTWLDTQLDLQSKLNDSDDPVLTTVGIDNKIRELEIALNRIMAKMARQQDGGSSGDGGKKKKKDKKSSSTKSKKSKTKTQKTEGSSTTVAAGAKETPKKEENKDEL